MRQKSPYLWWPSLLWISIFLLKTSAFAGPHDLPPLEDDAQKLAFLLEAKRQIPALFSDAAKYDIDLFTLLENERDLIAKLKTYPKYEQLFSQKPYFDLTVTPPKEGISVGAVEIKPEAIQDWKKSLSEEITQLLAEGVPTPYELLSKIQEFRRRVDFKEDPNKLIYKIGRVDQVGKTKEDKKAFKSKVEELKPKSAVLYQCHQEKSLLLKYECMSRRRAELEALPHLPSPSELADLVSALRAEEKLHSMLEVFAVMKRSPETPLPPTWEEFRKQVDTLSAEDLIHLDDKNDALKPIIVHALGNSEGSPGNDRAVEAVHKAIRSYANQTSSHLTMATEPVKITQVLPELGIFRGCTGGDCSSQNSFPYPNDPHEMVFFIEDVSEVSQPKKLKGYVNATEVQLSNGDKALYINTISGNRVNSGNAEVILRGLEKEKAKLGVKHIVLPTQSNITSLINFPAIRGVYETYTKKGKPEAITYQDLPMRQTIENFKPGSGYNVGQYDHSTENSEGIIFKADRQSERLATAIDQHGLGVFQPKSIEEVPPVEILEFILDLHHSGRDSLKNRVLEINSVKNKINSKILDLFLTQLGTCQGEQETPTNVQQFKQSLQEKLKAMAVPNDFIDLHSHLLYPGIARCTDAYSEDNIEETAKWIAKDLKDNYYRPKGVNFSSLPLDNKRLLENTPIFQKLFNKLTLNLKDPNLGVSRSAAEALGEIKPTDPKIHLALAEVLKDSNSNVRYRVAVTLGKIKPTDPRVHLALAEVLKDSNSDVRSSAVYALGEIKPTDPRVHLALAEALKDSNSDVRYRVAVTLGKIKPTDPRVHLALAEVLKDSNSDVRSSAAEALGEIKPTDPKIHLALAEVLKDSNSNVLSSAAKALGEVKPTDPRVHLALVETLKDSNSNVRSSAAWALGKIKPTDPRVHLALVETLKDSNIIARLLASEVLRAIQKSSPKEKQDQVFQCIGNPSSPLSNEKIEELLKIMEIYNIEHK